MSKMSPNGSATSTESILLHLLCRVDAARQRALYRQRKQSHPNPHHHHHHPNHRLTSSSSSSSSFTSELRSLELWRSTMAECLASFLYVFLLCATHLTWNGSAYIFGPAPNWLVIALTSGLAMATLVQCFGHISGGQVNPALTVALAVTRKISPLRAVWYLVGHCCGAIAGAALLYGVTVTGSQSMGPLGITTGHDSLNAWQVLAVEFLLTFVVIFTTYATYDANRRSFGSDSLSIGIAYLVASLTGLPASGASMNPARTLGPAFVMNRWQYHWVYWLGPLSGAIVAALIYEFIFDTKKASLGNYLLDTFDDLERESNVEDDYEDPDLTHHQHHQTLGHQQQSQHHTININGGGGGKMTMLGAHKPMYSSASAASSGSSSGGGHSRSNHTQHSIVSVHGNGNGGGGSGGGGQQGPAAAGLPYDAYRPMISSFGAGGNNLQQQSSLEHQQQQQSPSQIYNEPTGPTSYYATGALPDRPGTGGNSSGGSSANGGNGAPGTTFFCPPNSSAAAAARFSHSTMRASLHRLNYEQQQQQGSVGSVNPKF